MFICISQEFVTISYMSLYNQFILCSFRGRLNCVIRGAPFAAECEVARFCGLCCACDCAATAPADVNSSTTWWKGEGHIIGSLPLRKIKKQPNIIRSTICNKTTRLPFLSCKNEYDTDNMGSSNFCFYDCPIRLVSINFSI